MEQAFFFLPDISGFTSFVTTTEQVHSRHLISELLEVVIAENMLGLELQEIEGDAVFFLRRGPAPADAEIAEQARRMFIAFHTHLRIIERDTVCQCGACRTVSNLTLKFIAHAGAFESTSVAGRSSVHGSDVILAHRLMKTGIPLREYLLMTGTEMSSVSSSDWLEWNAYEEHIEHFGTVPMRYVALSPLLQLVPDAAALPDHTPRGRARTFRLNIEAPMHLVHALLIDPETKKDYIPGLRESRNEQPINRVQSSHTCVFDDFEVHFVTLHNAVENREIRYRESADVSVGFGLIADYRLKDEKGSTLLTVRFFPSGKGDSGGGRSSVSMLARLKQRIQFSFALRNTRRNLRRFGAYCERAAGSDTEVTAPIRP